jgi:hypothetical protein
MLVLSASTIGLQMQQATAGEVDNDEKSDQNLPRSLVCTCD